MICFLFYHYYHHCLIKSRATLKLSASLLPSIGVSIIIDNFFTALCLSSALNPSFPILPKPICSWLSRLEFNSALESFRCTTFRFLAQLHF